MEELASPIAVWCVVLICSLLQSAFGVGLLVFGTPLLLLLGIPFQDALWLLLPASLTISLLQIVLDRHIDRASAGRVARFALPALAVGVFMGLMEVKPPQLDLVIAAALVSSAALRLSVRAATAARRFSMRHEPAMLAVIGFVHGVSNMGGSLLPAYAAARHQDRLALRQTIATAYALFATTQLIVLSFVSGHRPNGVPILMAATAGGAFLALGRRAFHRVPTPLFTISLTVFMLAIAAMLVVRKVLSS